MHARDIMQGGQASVFRLHHATIGCFGLRTTGGKAWGALNDSSGRSASVLFFILAS
jgi:hypothetical protein